MYESKTLVPKKQPVVLHESQLPLPPKRGAYDPKQRRLMVAALAMLLVALGFVLYQNRDFWFPDTEEAESDAPAATTPTTTASAATTPAPSIKAVAPASKPKHIAKAEAPKASPEAPPVSATANRTVLPPLEVEVIAGDTHRTVRPGNNSVRVDMQPGSPPRAATEGQTTETAANVTTNAADRVQMSADTTDVVSHPVNPGYPMLARQMKVQGSVILQALISKDGTIQDLHVVSGPPILASAAQAAVRQWHFKPHFQGSEAVETQAKITVNFTISTN